MGNNVSLLDRYKNTNLNRDELEVAHLVRIDSEGYAYIQCQNNKKELRAYTLNDVFTQQGIKETLPLPVLVLFDVNHTPIIINTLLEKILPGKSAAIESAENKAVELTLTNSDGSKSRVLNLDAQEEINLRCGKSEITLRKNGKIVVKGVEIISRAVTKNKIRGASVLIN